METIFSHSPTKEELESLISEISLTEDEYINVIRKRAIAKESSEDYEILIDLQELFSIRGDSSKVNQYKYTLETDYADLRNKLFNE